MSEREGERKREERPRTCNMADVLPQISAGQAQRERDRQRERARERASERERERRKDRSGCKGHIDLGVKLNGIFGPVSIGLWHRLQSIRHRLDH